MALSAFDHAQLARALDLAQGAIGLSDPNPRVGCVITDPQGRVLGQGHTQEAGGPHAEVMALRNAAQDGQGLAGGTAYVSLEPCAHQGRTPPCTAALIAAGLARVVVAVVDPFERVAGQGIEQLRAAGLQVDIAEAGTSRAAAQALNIGFFSRVLRRRPWVRMKVAMSLDARTALADGRSQWITGAAARADGHAWRARAGAVLTGIGTVLDDDPRLDVRLYPVARQPLRIVLDSQFRTPPGARLLAPPGRVQVIGATPQALRMAALAATGSEVSLLPDPYGRVDLQALMPHLAAQGINELHVEAGARLNAGWLAAGLVDELLVYLAPKLLGPGRGLADLPALGDLADAAAWQFKSVELVGPDLRLRLQAPGADAFLDRKS